MGPRHHHVLPLEEYFVNSAPALNETSPLGIWNVTTLIVTLAAVSSIRVAPQVTQDFWLQFKVGELITSNFGIPKSLLFPFTDIQTAKFNAHAWLPSVLFYEMIQLFGEKASPQMFVVYRHLLGSCRQKASPKSWIGLVTVVILWSNTHGAFTLAPIVAGFLLWAYGSICAEDLQGPTVYPRPLPSLLGYLLCARWRARPSTPLAGIRLPSC